MDMGERGFGETGDRAVCLECVLDKGLGEQMARLLTRNRCTFCGRESPGDQPIAADFEDVMHLVMNAIRFFYLRSADSLFGSDDVTPRYESDDVVYTVCDAAVTGDVLEAILEVIDADDWNEDPSVLRPDVALRHAWDNFREKVKHQSRFVFLSVPEERSDHPDEFTTAEILAKLVEIIETRRAHIVLPPGHLLYRGRMFDRAEPLFTYSSDVLGAPPPDRASANRMSPAGISMFYGCDDIATVVAEIGAHSVSRFAVVGAFETTRPLRLVDLANLASPPSVFDPGAREGYYESRFLHAVARDLSEPVDFDGREHIEYVPTQVVMEYLRWLPHPSVDGVMFRSAQNGGRSCVVFCGPEGCADEGEETPETMLRLLSGSVRVVRVVSTPADF
ncbi:RES domain-containing protein [Streptosporangiaceae bacterium NEAU-GS5]|nr:RES domain-containing protein [Streptosporangiaceae bacterium NEAU-GS5]